MKLWDSVAFDPLLPSPLQRLARRILSVCCNSASCERLFSMYGMILTKRRSRLRSDKMTDQAELRLHLRDEHLREETVQARLKRKTTSHHAPEFDQTGSNSEQRRNTSMLISIYLYPMFANILL